MPNLCAHFVAHVRPHAHTLTTSSPRPGLCCRKGEAATVRAIFSLYIMSTKSSLRVLGCLGLLLFSASLLQAQLLTASNIELKADAEITGTIKDYSAGNTLVLETLPPNEPIQFKLARNVSYADTDGKPIEAAGLTTNRRVRVHYHKINGDNIADKISLIGN